MITKELVLNSLFERLTNLYESEGQYITPIYEWEWQQGVGLYSIYKLYKKTGDEKYIKFLDNWYKIMLENGIPERNVNTTAPFLVMACLAEENYVSEIDYKKYALEHAEWVMKKFPRTTDGGFQHLTREYIHREHIWADTIFMTVLFLAKVGKMMNRQDYMDEAIYQSMVHVKYLTDPYTGLYYHGWSFLPHEKHIGKVFWGRGNSWITMGIPELIEIAGDRMEASTKRFLVNSYRRQVESLVELQDNEGMWRTILNDQKSYFETSATAAFAAGIMKGISLGILEEKYSFNAFMGVRYIVDNLWKENGDLGNVSYGTPIGSDSEHYLYIPFCQAPYGQADMIFALLELKETKRFDKGFVMPWKN